MKLFLDTNVFVEFIEHRKQYESVSLIIDAILEEQHNSLLPQRNRRCHCPMSLNDEERRTLVNLQMEKANRFSNTDDWYDLFDVKPTDKLYLAPEKRIRIW